MDGESHICPYLNPQVPQMLFLFNNVSIWRQVFIFRFGGFAWLEVKALELIRIENHIHITGPAIDAVQVILKRLAVSFWIADVSGHSGVICIG